MRALALLPLVLLTGCGAKKAPLTEHADRVLIEKSKHTMTLYQGTRVLRTYRVSIGHGDGGPKRREGDHQTPEGLYTIDAQNPHSDYYRALHVSYPNADDRARAAAAGVPPGGDIMIHGIKNGFGWLGPLHRKKDWTEGCIAVTDAEMDEVWKLVPVGTPVEIRH